MKIMLKKIQFIENKIIESQIISMNKSFTLLHERLFNVNKKSFINNIQATLTICC